MLRIWDIRDGGPAPLYERGSGLGHAYKRFSREFMTQQIRGSC
jgi:hypothetical protein